MIDYQKRKDKNMNTPMYQMFRYSLDHRIEPCQPDVWKRVNYWIQFGDYMALQLEVAEVVNEK